MIGHPNNASILYATVDGRGIFKSVDSAASWESVNKGISNKQIQALVIDPLTPDKLYEASDGSGIFKTINGGGNWAKLQDSLLNTLIDD